MRRWFGWVPKVVGVRELHVYGGVALAGWGVGELLGWGYALVMAGVVLFYLGAWWAK